MKTVLLLIFFFALAIQINAQTITDVDNNTYNTVIIGQQIWMKENLKTTKYNDGKVIPKVTDASVWTTLITPAYCWYNNDSVTYTGTYGALYNWHTVNTGKLCPSGWHVPTDDDWTQLTTSLGGESIAGSALKEAGNTHWTFSNTDATNSSGFTALPGGCRMYSDGSYNFLTNVGTWWTATAFNTQYVFMRELYNIEIYVYRGFVEKNDGHYVRCIKNMNTSSNNLTSSEIITMHPNPAIDKLYIDNLQSLNSKVMIYDFQGFEVINIPISNNPIDISNLSTGTYLVKIIDSDNIEIFKLIKK